ncbi:MAG: PEP-CTERM sorting domain-containing protein [Pseudomonadota bacterium]
MRIIRVSVVQSTAESTMNPMPKYLLAVIFLASLYPDSKVAALTIEFDYTYDTRGFFTDEITGAPIQNRRAILEAAGSVFSSFTDNLSAINPGAGDSWQVTITHPSLDGAPVTLVNEIIPADTLRIFVGGSPLGPGVLGFAGSGGQLSATGSSAFVDAVNTRGQGVTSGATATDTAPWGGYIWFNSFHNWYFDIDPIGLTTGNPDFLTTATHEIAHILGIGDSDAWAALVNNNQFFGSASMSLHGGPVDLDPFNSHWAEGTLSVVDGIVQETLLDPSTPAGERQLMTALDFAALQDIGWEVPSAPQGTPVPIGSIPLVFSTILLALGGGRALGVEFNARIA